MITPKKERVSDSSVPTPSSLPVSQAAYPVAVSSFEKSNPL